MTPTQFKQFMEVVDRIEVRVRNLEVRLAAFTGAIALFVFAVSTGILNIKGL